MGHHLFPFKTMGLVALLCTGSVSQALAWDRHETLMPAVANRLAADPDESLRALLQSRHPAPCGSSEEMMYRELAGWLQLNAEVRLPPTFAQACSRPDSTVSPDEILRSAAVDEPDQGMDQNLDASPGNPYDPDDDRKYMGGNTGPTSQGFRHMYFGGVKILRPLKTFQIPLHAIGQSPNRAEALATKARQLLEAGEITWGFRVLTWALHFAQDMTQPFHSTQVPSLKLIPWLRLLKWPLSQGFEDLRVESTRIVANYHFAYEKYVYLRLTETTPSVLAGCAARPDRVPGSEKFIAKASKLGPKKLTLEIAKRSSRLANDVSRHEAKVFGKVLKEPGVDLPNGKNEPDYNDFLTRPDLIMQRARLEKYTCTALADAVIGSERLIRWAVEPLLSRAPN